VSVGNYTLKYLRPSFTPGANHDEIRAVFSVTRGGEKLGVVAAGKNRYHVESFFSNAVAIRTDWLRAEDLFVIGDQFNRDGSVDVKVFVNPLVGLIWLAGLVFLLGSVVAMWPDAREQRRLAWRGAELQAVARA
jgi:cytochrome c biogenesis factor